MTNIMKEISNMTNQRPKKQNHANIPCPIENCARFTYGKLPDHLTKRHGLTGKEREIVNERQRKRFFNGELCQVKFLKESAIMDLWGEDYRDPKIKKKIHDSYAMVKIRIIPISATTNRILPLTEQDANVLTNYNARTIEKPKKVSTKRKNKTLADEDSSTSDISLSPKRRKSYDSSEGEENTSTPIELRIGADSLNKDFIDDLKNTISPSHSISDEQYATISNNEESVLDTTSSSESDCTNYTYEIINESNIPNNSLGCVSDILDSKIDERYKFVINDLKKSMIMGRTLSSKKQRTYRSYKRYAKRLISYLQKQNSPILMDIDLMLCNETQICAFIESVHTKFKAKTVRNYIIACIKLLDSRLFVIETDPTCKQKVSQMTTVYSLLHKYLMECMKLIPKKPRENSGNGQMRYDFDTANMKEVHSNI